MKAEDIEAALKATQIPIADERAVPSNGTQKPLPYLVIRKEMTDYGDDMGRLRLQKISWTVALFTANKDPELESRIRRAIAPVGTVKVQAFPDGVPYECNFEFKTVETGGI